MRLQRWSNRWKARSPVRTIAFALVTGCRSRLGSFRASASGRAGQRVIGIANRCGDPDCADRRCAARSRTARRQGFHHALPGHCPGRAIVGPGFSMVATPAFRQHVLHAVHHPRQHPNPGRLSAAILEAGLDAWNRLVLLPNSGPKGVGVDRARTIPYRSPDG